MKVCTRSAAALAAFAASFAPAALAQAPAEDGAAGAARATEIIVTAQKRSERLRDVPVSITALNADQLSETGIANPRDLAGRVPGFTYLTGGSSKAEVNLIRGVGTFALVDTEASVSTVVDGVTLGRQGMGLTDFFDVDRVEVLRGPQSTLFGKGASAGVINIVTKQPTDVFSGEAQVAVGNYDLRRVRGAVSGPILPGLLSARISAGYTTRDGFIPTPAADGKEANNRNEYGMRARVLYTPTTNFDLLLTGEYVLRKERCCASVLVSFPEPGDLSPDQAFLLSTLQRFGSGATGIGVLNQVTVPVEVAPGVFQPFGLGAILSGQLGTPPSLVLGRPGVLDFTTPSEQNRINASDGAPRERNELFGATAEANYRFGDGLTLTSVTGYRGYEQSETSDADGSPYPLAQGGGGGFTFGSRSEYTQWSQEVRLSSDDDGRLSYILGLYFYSLTNDTDSVTTTFGQVVPQLGGRQETRNYAIFGDATYAVTEKLSASVGARLSLDELEGRSRSLFGGGQFSSSTDDTSWQGRAVLRYAATPSVNVYGSVARGYKGPAFRGNTVTSQAEQDAELVRPEEVNAYEIGVKSLLFGDRLAANASAFWSEYTDLQSTFFFFDDPLNPFQLLNVPETRTRGVELDFNARLTDAFSVVASGAFVEAVVRRFDNAPCFALGAPNCSVENGRLVQDLRNARGAVSPKYSYTVAGIWDQAVAGSVRGFARVDYTWRSSVNYDLQQDRRLIEGAVGLLSARLGLRSEDERLQLSLFGDNLTDEDYSNLRFRTVGYSGVSRFAQIGETYGVQLDVKF